MRLWTVLIAATALLIAGCGRSDSPHTTAESGNHRAPTAGTLATGTATSPVPGANTITVTLTEYGIQLDTDKLSPGPVRLVVRNAGQRGHELQVYPSSATAHGGHDQVMTMGGTIPDAVGHLQLVPVGATQALDLTFPTGSWELGCHLKDNEGGVSFDHYERGMKTTLTVAA